LESKRMARTCELFKSKGYKVINVSKMVLILLTYPN
jgi:hypothetical protein